MNQCGKLNCNLLELFPCKLTLFAIFMESGNLVKVFYFPLPFSLRFSDIYFELVLVFINNLVFLFCICAATFG